MSNLSPFAAGKNPPWVRNTGQNIQNIQQQMLGQIGSIAGQPMVQYQQANQQVYQQTLGLQQPNITMASMASLNSNLQSGIAGQLYPQVATVSYPAPRTLNTNAFQQSVANVAQQVQQNVSSSSNKQRVFTGTVTKVHDNFGFVDEDVFFQTNACVKGSNPSVGDRVLVEASFNPSMPFKWNATRIQVLPMSNSSGSSNQQQQQVNQNRQSQQSRSSSAYNAVPPPSDNSRFNSGNSNSNMSSRTKPSGGRIRERSPRDRRNDDEEVERKRRREERIRDRDKKDDRSPSRSRRSKSPRPRRRTRVVPRYMVQIPKIALDLPEADVLEVKRRYPNMYIPSDFFNTSFRWTDAFPPHTPFTLNKACSFHIMNKDTDSCTENTAVLEPPDADYLFSAKVMLISMPMMEEIYKRCCGVPEDRESDRDYVHPTRLVNFLVGLRGKSETMAIGGPWSPSLDGPNPEKDPSVLIKTAIRTCKALTGIDLSNCTQWYRFLELYYRRAETTHKSGRVVPSRVETVILFLPDVWRCVPTRLEWDGLHLNYKKQLERKLQRSAAGPDAEIEPETTADVDEAAPTDQKDESITETREPTHYSELDPKTMIVATLREELKARNLDSKGLKAQLQARLTKALKTEQNKEEGNDEEMEVDSVQESTDSAKEDQKDLKEEKDSKESKDQKDSKESKESKELKDQKDQKDSKDQKELKHQDSKEQKDQKEEKKVKDAKDLEEEKRLYEKEKAQLEKRYSLPELPHIVVHPSKTAKSGKFDCTVMSLSVLLDYRPEDTKEHSFEVSLFAELFNEMLMRDFGFRIYRSLYYLPEKVKEKEEDKKKDKKEDKKKEDDKKGKKDERKDDKKDDKKEEKKEEMKEDKKEDKKEPRKDDKRAEVAKDKRDEKEAKPKSDDRDKEEDDDDEEDESDDDDSTKEGKKDRDKESKKKKVKLYTHDPYLLLSFVYFDQTHCGYIFDKDLEELIYILGLNLSRAQVRKLVQKVVTRDSLHYRKLTDGTKEDEVKEGKKDEKTEDAASENPDEIKSLALGNKKLLPVFTEGKSPSRRTKTETGTACHDSFVMYKGSLLDVEKLISQLQRSENARLKTESKMMEVQHDLTVLAEKSTKQSNTIKDLSEDLKSYKDKLRNVDDKLKKVSNESHSYFSSLKSIYHIASKSIQNEVKKVEVVEIQDEKSSSGEINGIEQRSKNDTRWSDTKGIKKEESDKEKKVKKELVEDEKKN